MWFCSDEHLTFVPALALRVGDRIARAARARRPDRGVPRPSPRGRRRRRASIAGTSICAAGDPREPRCGNPDRLRCPVGSCPDKGGRNGRHHVHDRVRRRCSDGPCGAVSKVVVDPVARELTHLVVEPEHRSGLGRLVPLDLVEPDGGGVHAALHPRRVRRAPVRRGDRFPPRGSGYAAYAAHEAYYWPYFGLEGGADPLVALASAVETRDTLPPGEIGVRRGEARARHRRRNRQGRGLRRRLRRAT